MKTIGFVAAATLVLASAAEAQPGSKTPPRPPSEPTPVTTPLPRSLGPIVAQVYVGEGAPDFELDGSRGRPVKLSELRGQWVLLAFADRRRDLAPLQEIESELVALGAMLVGTCHESAHSLRSQAQRDSVKFLILSDVTGEISGMYGLLDRGRSATRPGFLMIDRKGIVRMAVLGQMLPRDEIARLARYAVTGM